MADPMAFGNAWVSTISELLSAIEKARFLQDRATQDPGLAQAYLSASGRTDIVIADLQAAYTNLNSFIAALDAGNPPLKAAIYKVLIK